MDNLKNILMYPYLNEISNFYAKSFCFLQLFEGHICTNVFSLCFCYRYKHNTIFDKKGESYQEFFPKTFLPGLLFLKCFLNKVILAHDESSCAIFLLLL